MNESNAVMLARTEHELMVQSLPQISEYDENVIAEEPGWVVHQAGRVLYALESGFAVLGERLEHERNA